MGDVASGKVRIRHWNIGGGKIDVLIQQIVHPRSTAICAIGHVDATGHLRIGSKHLREQRVIEG